MLRRGILRFDAQAIVNHRDGSRRGVRAVDLGLDESATTLVWRLGVGVGLGNALSLHASVPLVQTWLRGRQLARTHEGFGVGDLWLVGRAALPVAAGVRAVVGAGVSVPVGTGVENPVSSERNFVSGTWDPVLELGVGRDFRFDGWSVSADAFAAMQVPAYARDDGRRAGASFFYGGAGGAGLLDEQLTLRVSAFAVNRRPNRGGPAPGPRTGVALKHGDGTGDEDLPPDVSASGGDSIYVEPRVGWHFRDGPLAGLGVSGGVRVPVYEYVRGVQLDDVVTGTLMLSFELPVAPRAKAGHGSGKHLHDGANKPAPAAPEPEDGH